MADKQPSKLEQWKADSAPAEWLRAQLGSPMGQFFLAVLEERHPLRLNRALAASVHTANGTALSSQMTGYEQCLQTIRVMSNEASIDSLSQLTPTYGVTKPEQATE